MLAWLDEILKVRHPSHPSPTRPLRTIDVSRGWEGYIRACPSDVQDGWGSPTWNVAQAFSGLEKRLRRSRSLLLGFHLVVWQING